MAKLVISSIIWMIAAPAGAENCNWGFVGPTIYTCHGKRYYSGTVACDSGVYNDVFCQERFKNDGAACAGDRSPETLRCKDRVTKAKDREAVYNGDSR